VHFVAQSRLVDHSGALLVVEQLSGIQRAPPAVGAPDLVQHQRVGVQLRVPGPDCCDGRTPPPPARPSRPARPRPVPRRTARVACPDTPGRPGPRRGARPSPRRRAESPSAHSALTLLGAEKVRSKPVTPSVRHARPSRLPVPGADPGRTTLRAPAPSPPTGATVRAGPAPAVPAPRGLTHPEVVLTSPTGDAGGVVPPRAGADLRRAQHQPHPRRRGNPTPPPYIRRMHMSAALSASAQTGLGGSRNVRTIAVGERC
jgi:hypothetical protein